MKHRNFTRTDVENFVTETIGKAQSPTEETRFEIQQVALLSNAATMVPIWLVDYVVIDTSGLFPSRYRGSILVTQSRKYALSSDDYLAFLDTIPLPEHCLTVKQEDRTAKIVPIHPKTS